MKYTTKTAIEIMTEEDKPQLIPFMESIKQGCNVVWNHKAFWSINEIKTGDVWYINDDYGLQLVQTDWEHELVTKDYTILKGVPQNWKEEIVGLTETFIENCGVKIMPSRLDQLESENKELRELMMPWGNLYNDGWRIVGMNHYNLNGKSHLFVSMTKDNLCIVSESEDETSVWEQLENKAKQLLEK